MKSKLPNSVLGKIWKLADYDKDGYLDDEEFALAMHLIKEEVIDFSHQKLRRLWLIMYDVIGFMTFKKVKLDGNDLPSTLPDHLVPPGQRPGF